MDTSLNVANAWQRLRRQSLLVQGVAPGATPMSMPAANADDFLDGDLLPLDASETLPMLYRSEAFAEDLFDSHPQAAG